MSIDASINIHHAETKAEVRFYEWFFNYKIGGVNFFFNTEDEIIEFKNNINNAYTAYKKEEVDK